MWHFVSILLFISKDISLDDSSHNGYSNEYPFILTFKGPLTTAADDIFFFFSEKTSLDISCEIHKKREALFSLKNKKFFRMSSATNFVWRFKG